MVAPPANGPMLCARCQERRPKRVHAPRKGERRSTDAAAVMARAKVRAFYGTPEWKRTRAIVRQRDGACVMCGSRDRLSVDHIIPRRDAPHLAFELSNLRTLCASCHGRRDGARSNTSKARVSPLTRSQGASRVLEGGPTDRHGGEPSRGAYGLTNSGPLVA